MDDRISNTGSLLLKFIRPESESRPRLPRSDIHHQRRHDTCAATVVLISSCEFAATLNQIMSVTSSALLLGSDVSAGLHFVPIDRDLHHSGWPSRMDRLDRRRSQQRHHLRNCRADLANRLHSRQPVLPRALWIQRQEVADHIERHYGVTVIVAVVRFSKNSAHVCELA